MPAQDLEQQRQMLAQLSAAARGQTLADVLGEQFGGAVPPALQGILKSLLDSALPGRMPGMPVSAALHRSVSSAASTSFIANRLIQNNSQMRAIRTSTIDRNIGTVFEPLLKNLSAEERRTAVGAIREGVTFAGLSSAFAGGTSDEEAVSSNLARVSSRRFRRNLSASRAFQSQFNNEFLDQGRGEELTWKMGGRNAESFTGLMETLVRNGVIRGQGSTDEARNNSIFNQTRQWAVTTNAVRQVLGEGIEDDQILGISSQILGGDLRGNDAAKKVREAFQGVAAILEEAQVSSEEFMQVVQTSITNGVDPRTALRTATRMMATKSAREAAGRPMTDRDFANMQRTEDMISTSDFNTAATVAAKLGLDMSDPDSWSSNSQFQLLMRQAMGPDGDRIKENLNSDLTEEQRDKVRAATVDRFEKERLASFTNDYGNEITKTIGERADISQIMGNVQEILQLPYEQQEKALALRLASLNPNATEEEIARLSSTLVVGNRNGLLMGGLSSDADLRRAREKTAVADSFNKALLIQSTGSSDRTFGQYLNALGSDTYTADEATKQKQRNLFLAYAVAEGEDKQRYADAIFEQTGVDADSLEISESEKASARAELVNAGKLTVDEEGNIVKIGVDAPSSTRNREAEAAEAEAAETSERASGTSISSADIAALSTAVAQAIKDGISNANINVTVQGAVTTAAVDVA